MRLLLCVLLLCSAFAVGCERKEKVLDVEVGGDQGIKVEGYKSDDGSVEIKVDERN